MKETNNRFEPHNQTLQRQNSVNGYVLLLSSSAWSNACGREVTARFFEKFDASQIGFDHRHPAAFQNGSSSDHRARTSNHPFQEHAQILLRVHHIVIPSFVNPGELSVSLNDPMQELPEGIQAFTISQFNQRRHANRQWYFAKPRVVHRCVHIESETTTIRFNNREFWFIA